MGSDSDAKRPGLQLVARAYQAHHQHQTVNPDSYFLRFPDSDRNRIIALPATIATPELQVSGIKWIASYPANLNKGLERASAVIILNDAETGYPFAVMEGAQISAMRTAASAVLGADHCSNLGRRAKSVAFVGGGLISRTILNQFCARGWQRKAAVWNRRWMPRLWFLPPAQWRPICLKVFSFHLGKPCSISRYAILPRSRS